MQPGDNIEQLFKETLGHFEADVNPSAWTNIQHSIGSGTGSAASAGAKFGLGKIIGAGLAAVGIAAAGTVWYFSRSETKEQAAVPVHAPAAEPVQQLTDEPKAAPAEDKLPVAAPAAGSRSVPSVNSSSSAAHFLHPLTPGRPEPSGVTRTNDNSGNPAASSSGNVPASVANSGNVPAETNPAHGTSPQNPRPGTKDNSSSEMHVAPATPVASIFASAYSGDAPFVVSFTGQTEASSVIWDFGDGSSSDEISPKHTFDKAGKYEVVMTAKNTTGATSSKITIEVKPVSFIGEIPNVFSPNGDGQNDLFSFQMKNIALLGVVIINDRGETVYQSNSLEAAWNGKKINGEDAPAGTYIYSIQAKGTDGAPHTRKGFITLER